jgi:hypothetical protein
VLLTGKTYKASHISLTEVIPAPKTVHSYYEL